MPHCVPEASLTLIVIFWHKYHE